MRRVIVEGQKYDIPRKEAYSIAVNASADGQLVTRRYRFLPEPEQLVMVEETCTPLEMGIGQDTTPWGIRATSNETYDMLLEDFLSPEEEEKKLRSHGKAFYDWDKKLIEDYLNSTMIRDISVLKKTMEDKEDVVSSTFTGQRVVIANRRDPNCGSRGTVVGPARAILVDEGCELEAEIYGPGAVLLCMDDESPNFNDGDEAAIRFTGRHRSKIIDKKSLQAFPDQYEDSFRAFLNVPHDIGVYVKEPFSHDDGIFEAGETGRIIAMTRSRVAVQWHRPMSWGWVHKGTSSANCYNVPPKYLNWCRLRDVQDIAQPWPHYGNSERSSGLKAGELVTVHAGRHVTCCDRQGNERHLPDGTVAKIVVPPKKEDRHGLTHLMIVGGPDMEFLGMELAVRRDFIRPHPEPEIFHPKDQLVEIVAEIDFRKRPLQGMKARVVLPTDSEGDVGLEFPEDIKAGSLDGIGKQGHCLYVQASAVKASE